MSKMDKDILIGSERKVLRNAGLDSSGRGPFGLFGDKGNSNEPKPFAWGMTMTEGKK